MLFKKTEKEIFTGDNRLKRRCERNRDRLDKVRVVVGDFGSAQLRGHEP